MNKKEWKMYNEKLLAEGKKSADKEKIIDTAHKNGAEVVMSKSKPNKKFNQYYHKSAVNVHAMIKTVYKGISKYINKYYGKNKLTLDFYMKMTPQHQGGATAVVLYKPTLHLNMAITQTKSGFTTTEWIKDLYVINPAFKAVSNPKSKFIYSYKPLDIHTDGYLHGVFDSFMKTPNMERMITWNDHYYVTKK